MARSISYDGKIEFQIKDKYWSVIKWIISLEFSEGVELHRNRIDIAGGWATNRVYIEDLICFIQRYGSVTHLNILAAGENDYDLSRYVLHNGQVKYIPFEFNEETQRAVTEEEAVELLGECYRNYDYKVSREFKNSKEKRTFHSDLEDTLARSMYAVLGDEASEFISSLHTPGAVIILFSKKGKLLIQNGGYEWRSFEEDFQHAKEVKPAENPFVRGIPLYSTMDFDTPEEGGRQIRMGEVLFPLRAEIFPESPNEALINQECIVLPTGQTVTICKICKHRTRKVLNMCKACKPDFLLGPKLT